MASNLASTSSNMHETYKSINNVGYLHKASANKKTLNGHVKNWQKTFKSYYNF